MAEWKTDAMSGVAAHALVLSALVQLTGRSGVPIIHGSRR